MKRIIILSAAVLLLGGCCTCRKDATQVVEQRQDSFSSRHRRQKLMCRSGKYYVMSKVWKEIRDWLGNSCRNEHEREEVAKAMATLIVGLGVVLAAVIVLGVVIALV